MKSYILNRYIRFLAATALLILLAFPFHSSSKAEDKQLDFRESRYNNIYVYKRGPFIAMTFGRNKRFYTETVYDSRDNKVLPVTYTRYMTLAAAYTDRLSSILEIGFGGGRTTQYLHEHLEETSITSVELDPVVVELAEKYFGIKRGKNFEIVIDDGRRFLTGSRKKWDIIMIDAYRGSFVPFHLLTKEFFTDIKSRLTENGVVVQNIEPSTMMFDSAIATIATVFDNIDLYQADGNVVALAYNGSRKSQKELIERAQSLQSKHNFRYNLVSMLKERRYINKTNIAKVLTDDFAPVEALLAIDRHNRKLDELSERVVK